MAPRTRGVRGVGLLVAALGTLSLLLGARPPENGAKEDATDTEYKVKSASIYHFLRYVTWPESSFENEEAPFVVLVVGRDPFGKRLEVALEGKTVRKRPVALRRSASVPDTIDAHFVFEGGLKAEDQALLLARCANEPILLFGERPGYAQAGAGGNFYIDEDRVRFEINIDVVRAAKLEVSSQLLKLARIVRNEKKSANDPEQTPRTEARHAPAPREGETKGARSPAVASSHSPVPRPAP
jgi:hypothetical protein